MHRSKSWKYSFNLFFLCGLVLIVLSIVKRHEITSVMKAVRGNANAQYSLATYCEKKGQNNKAFSWYKEAAEQGHAMAQLKVGLYYLSNKESSEALKCFNSAAEQGNADAQYMLGVNFFAENNYEKGCQWLTKAADQGHIKSIYELADYHFLQLNYSDALRFYEKAAQEGDTNAEFNIALVKFIKSKKEQEDIYCIATEWFEKAAASGNPDAEFHLAYCLFNCDKERDFLKITSKYNKIVSLLKSSAKKGNSNAMILLSKIYGSHSIFITDKNVTLEDEDSLSTYWENKAILANNHAIRDFQLVGTEEIHLRKAAEKGSVIAQKTLTELLEAKEEERIRWENFHKTEVW